MEERVYNFSAGPATLPEEVLKIAAGEMLNYRGSGMSVMELSHRSPEFTEIIQDAKTLLRDLMNIPDNYQVLFVQGGASLQFLMAPMNLLDANKKADYVNTGAWSKKAIAEVKKLGDVHVVADSSDHTFSYIPQINPEDIRSDASYLHITSNNTIYGTRFNELPETTLPIVSDMSSMILSEVINVEDYGLIYAGAQKNIGPSGLALVIVRDDLIGKNEGLPSMLDYAVYAKNDSLFNTPPTYGIYMAKLVFEHLKELGGVPTMEFRNKRKAQMIYEAIDLSEVFEAHVLNENDRSRMNIPFFAETDEINAKFLQGADVLGLKTLKGHRSVGGMRASIYNAMPEKGCEILADYISSFQP
jgi:phosphoserine aminotransferase